MEDKMKIPQQLNLEFDELLREVKIQEAHNTIIKHMNDKHSTAPQPNSSKVVINFANALEARKKEQNNILYHSILESVRLIG